MRVQTVAAHNNGVSSLPFKLGSVWTRETPLAPRLLHERSVGWSLHVAEPSAKRHRRSTESRLQMWIG